MNKKPFWRDVRYVPYLYIMPNMVLFLLFMIIPLFMNFYYSLTNWMGIGKPKFIGLENYIWLFHDAVFWKSVLNTFIFTVLTVPLLMVIALFLAVLLNTKIPMRGLFRSMIYMPAVVSTVVVGTVFSWMFQDQLGLINYLLNLFGHASIKWFNDPHYSMAMIVAGTVWQRVGYNMVIYLAGLQGISQDYHEAATVDGATTWQRFRYITLPLLKNTHIFILLTCIIYSFRSFDLIYTMTKGGPLNATKTLVMYIYEMGFSKNYYGRAAAAGVILFIIIFIMSIWRMNPDKKKGE